MSAVPPPFLNSSLPVRSSHETATAATEPKAEESSSGAIVANWLLGDRARVQLEHCAVAVVTRELQGMTPAGACKQRDALAQYLRHNGEYQVVDFTGIERLADQIASINVDVFTGGDCAPPQPSLRSCRSPCALMREAFQSACLSPREAANRCKATRPSWR